MRIKPPATFLIAWALLRAVIGSSSSTLWKSDADSDYYLAARDNFDYENNSKDAHMPPPSPVDEEHPRAKDISPPNSAARQAQGTKKQMVLSPPPPLKCKQCLKPRLSNGGTCNCGHYRAAHRGSDHDQEPQDPVFPYDLEDDHDRLWTGYFVFLAEQAKEKQKQEGAVRGKKLAPEGCGLEYSYTQVDSSSQRGSRSRSPRTPIPAAKSQSPPQPKSPPKSNPRRGSPLHQVTAQQASARN